MTTRDASPAPPPATTTAPRIVIAGGSGFIGRALCTALTRPDSEGRPAYDLVVLTRSPDSHRARHTDSGLRFIHWNPESSKGAWTQELSGAAAVINLCGDSIASGRWTPARKRALIDSRTRPARTLIEAIRGVAPAPAMLVQASGVGYLGTGDTPADETAPVGNDFLATLARDWEATLTDASVATAALRFGVVLGQGGALPQMLLPFRLFAGGPIGDGRQWLSWIHIDDACAAIRFVIEQHLTGPVHVTAPEPVRNETFARAAGQVLRRPARLRLPRFALRALLGEQATLVCDGQHALPGRLLAAGFEFQYPDIESALRQLHTSTA